MAAATTAAATTAATIAVTTVTTVTAVIVMTTVAVTATAGVTAVVIAAGGATIATIAAVMTVTAVTTIAVAVATTVVIAAAGATVVTRTETNLDVETMRCMRGGLTATCMAEKKGARAEFVSVRVTTVVPAAAITTCRHDFAGISFPRRECRYGAGRVWR